MSLVINNFKQERCHCEGGMRVCPLGTAAISQRPLIFVVLAILYQRNSLNPM